MAAKALALERLRTALPRLHARYNQIADAERLEQWRARRAPIAAERDKLAQEFKKKLYPEIERQLVELLTKMEGNDREIAALHADAPDNSWNERLDGAELIARNLANFGRDTPSIHKALRLPRFADDAHLAWPVGLPWGRGVT